MSPHLGFIALLVALPHLSSPAVQPNQSGWPVLKERHEQFAFVAPNAPGVDQP